MVRPVEPEPPDALRRTTDCVKRAEATSEGLGYRQVKERQEHAGEHAEEKPNRTPDTDEVIIGSQAEGTVSGEGTKAAGRKKPRLRKCNHLDVKG